MPYLKKIVLGTAFLFSGTLCLMGQTGFTVQKNPDQKQVAIKYNGHLLTAYCYYDSIAKPVLYPVNTPDGITVTRGYPVNPIPGERTDHPHHVGIWMNYESVNGIDFWNNSPAIPAEKKAHYGSILHDSLIAVHSDKQKADLTAMATWWTEGGLALLKEKTTYTFQVIDQLFYIDRTTTLTALKDTVVFKDVKDGFFAIRVARELEMPSKEPGIFLDAHGNATRVAASDSKVTGMYYNANGVKGDQVWSSKADWAMLKGVKDGKPVTIVIFDHPGNIGYPAYWHARGYGLFAVNPLGRKIFSKGAETLNFKLSPGQSVTFRYRLVTGSRDLDPATVSAMAESFKK